MEVLNPMTKYDWNDYITFETMDGEEHWFEGNWDLIIAFPPCTYLTVTGNRWFNVDRYGEKAIKRHKNREEAVKFFMAFANADCERIAIENPVGIMSSEWRKPDQIINPWQFGDAFEKKTCLWLKGLPELTPQTSLKYRREKSLIAESQCRPGMLKRGICRKKNVLN